MFSSDFNIIKSYGKYYLYYDIICLRCANTKEELEIYIEQYIRSYKLYLLIKQNEKN